MPSPKSSPSRRGRPRIGRPPSGLRVGERVKDYPQVSLRLPTDLKLKLAAISRVRAQPQWRIMADALACIEGQLTADERTLVERLLRRRDK